MENTTQEMELQIRVENKELNSQLRMPSTATTQQRLPTYKDYMWWFRVSLYIVSLLAGQSAATLLGRLYYDKGGNSKWMATFVQSAGFPVLLPILLYVQLSKSSSNNAPPKHPSISTFLLLFLFFGLLLAGDNLMYSYGLLYLPVSTYSLICATQLAFNALFSFVLNSQKFTAYIFNSLVLLTVSASLLAVHPDSDSTTKVSKGKYIIGFLCTVGASATYSLFLSLLELTFKKVIKRETFDAVLLMQIYPSFVATCACVVGLFASGEWKTLPSEMKEYEKGRVSYVMTLFWTAVSWQISSVGLLGLISEVSSLFSNVISTISLPAIPILAVIFFHDKMDGVKVISLILAIWGFLSYVYQHYLDDVNAKSRTSMSNAEASGSFLWTS
ncbi:probable purine permease 11 [Coffea eugenioides]|uniref:probable purine permease 11 n=1 Tax=Coffea eugenioides TaxID=49369 RepID=UPI000F60B28E|nr:probable purine permease 11 [Coffea eugenioides]